MSTTPTERQKFDLSLVQLLAGCMAAVTAAVLASFFGIAGTIIGTALGSVVGTAGTAIYGYFLRRTRSRINGLRVHGRIPAAEQAAALPAWWDYLRRRWLMGALVAAGAFTIAMTTITGVEAAAGKQLWAIVTNQRPAGGQTTTVGGALSGLHPESSATPTPEPSSNPSAVPAGVPTPSQLTPLPSTSPTSTPTATERPPTEPTATP